MAGGKKKTPKADRKPDASRRRFVTWLWRLPVLAVLGGASYAFYEIYRVQFSKTRPSRTPVFTPQTPQYVASLNALGKPWDEVPFVFGTVPALALELPAEVPGGLSVGGRYYAAFSRVCTHQGCIINLNRNTEAVAVAYNYRSDTPVLVCPCHYSVFEADRAGEAVSGPATEPLPRVRLELRGTDLYATGLEATA